MSHDDGASTDVTGLSDFWRASITAGNGSLTSPEKLNPSIWLDSRVQTTGTIRQTENCIHNVIRVFRSGGEIINEGDPKILQLLCKALRER